MSQRLRPAIVEFFADIEDPRRETANKRHDLMDIIVIAVVGMICGADSWTEIAMVGEGKEKWLRTFLKLPNGIPSHDTFGRVFSLINPEQFRAAFHAVCGCGRPAGSARSRRRRWQDCAALA